MPPKLRQDLYDASAVATILLFGIAAAAWIGTWPGWIVPRVLSIVGVVGYALIRLMGGVFESGITAAYGSPPWARYWTVARGVAIAGLVGILLIHYVVVARIVGAVILGLMLLLSLPRIYKGARRRYGQASDEPATSGERDDPSQQHEGS
jgi:hypothetical protein